jgi:hypothetical protein
MFISQASVCKSERKEKHTQGAAPASAFVADLYQECPPQTHTHALDN